MLLDRKQLWYFILGIYKDRTLIKHDVNKNIYVSRLIEDVDERNMKHVFENFFKCLE